MMINSCLFPGTHYVLEYFSTSTSLCLGQGTDIYNEDFKMMINSCLFPGTHYVPVSFSPSTSLCLGQGTDIYMED